MTPQSHKVPTCWHGAMYLILSLHVGQCIGAQVSYCNGHIVPTFTVNPGVPDPASLPPSARKDSDGTHDAGHFPPFKILPLP